MVTMQLSAFPKWFLQAVSRELSIASNSAARNENGHVIMYADKITNSMQKALDETNRRRRIQNDYNIEHGITPRSIKKAVRELMTISKAVEAGTRGTDDKDIESMNTRELKALETALNKRMRAAAAELNFEEAIALRDKLTEVKKALYET